MARRKDNQHDSMKVPSENALLPWKAISEKSGIDGKGKYTIVSPRNLYLGKSYSDYVTDWFNWFLSAYADERNSGPVVFLRSHGLPNSNKAASVVSDQVTVSDTSPGNDHPKYENYPNIRTAGHRLQIFENQAVFVPIITAYTLGGSIAPSRDWGSLQDSTGLLIDNGDNPPDPIQLTINSEEIDLQGLGMEDFRITTPIFMAVVPEAPYGTSVKDFLEEGSIAAGVYPTLVDGYFVMLKFAANGSYWVHSLASAGREAQGPYYSELMYQIEVRERAVPHGRIINRRPAQNEAIFNRTLKAKEVELTDSEVKRFKLIQDQAKKL
jgi:hypothetical protein